MKKKYAESEDQLKRVQSNRKGLEEEQTYLKGKIHDLEEITHSQQGMISFAEKALLIVKDKQVEQEDQDVLKKIQSDKDN